MVKQKQPATQIATQKSNQKHNDTDACLKENLALYEETNLVDNILALVANYWTTMRQIV